VTEGTAKRLVEVPRIGNWKRIQEGLEVDVLVDPAAPQTIARNMPGEMWAGPAILGLFTVVLGGTLVSLWRWQPPEIDEVDGSEEYEDEKEAQEEETEASLAAPHDPGRLLVLRPADRVWKAQLFYAGLFVVFALLSGWGLLEGEYLAGAFFVLFLAGAAWLVRRAFYYGALEVRAEGGSIQLMEPGRPRRVLLRDIAHFARGKTIAAGLGKNGERLLLLDEALEPAEHYEELLQRVERAVGG
jgi:hypothetical protein